jgi:PAS domain S-box-containing protein
MSTMAASDSISIEGQSALFRHIVDSSPALLHTARPDGYLDFFNETWLEFAGLPLEKLLGWGWVTCIHPDDVEAFLRNMRESYARGKSFQETSRVRRADGVYRWMLHLKAPILDAAGNVIRWSGSSIDIDDRKRAEEQLLRSAQESQRNEFYLSEAQRLGHIGSWVFEPAGAFQYWSPELFRIYGLDPQRNPPTLEEYLACVHPHDREFMASLIRRMTAEVSGCDVTKRIVRPDGEIRHIRCVGAPVVENGIFKRIIGNAIDVTEQELLTREFRRRGAYLAEARRLSHTGSFGWNPETGEIVFSDETYRIYEIDPAEHVTLDRIIEQVHPDDRALALGMAKQASSTGGGIDFTHRLLFADGRLKFLRIMAKPLDNVSNGIEFAGAVIDITEAKRAEESLRKSERELRTMIEVLPAHVGVTQPDGTVDFVSQSWLDYTGFTWEQATGWGWTKAIHPEDLERDIANWQTALASGEPLEQEVRAKNAAGIYRWFLNRNIPLRDDDGKVLKWYGILFDIDALKETEQTLQMREHELRGIIETIPSMLWSTSPTGESTYLSQRFRDYWGVGFEEVANRGWENFIHPDDRQDTARAFFRAIETGESFSAIQRLRRSDGEYRWHHSMGEPLRDSSGKIIQWYGLSIDIDERKRTEDYLRETRAKLGKASRLATVAELAGSIAHELNQPLMAILANAQAATRWLNADSPNVAEVDASIGRIIRDANAADATIQHIRALFKQQVFDKNEVRIPDMLGEVVRIVQEDPKKRSVPITCRFEEPLPAVSIDQIQIQQAFINLIVNAIEALDGQPAPALVTIRAAVSGSDRLLIQVIDNGPGIHDPERIFDSFMTTKEKGMGMGLAVSRSILEAHGGRLWAENGDPRGAIFNVSLPLTRPS